MATPNDFIEYYKTISNTALLNILDNPGGYQPLAIDAANEEFLKRQLSHKEIQEAREPLIAKQKQKDKEREKVKAVETKIKTIGNTFFEAINPIQSGIPSAEKNIRLIVITLGGVFLFQFIRDFNTNVAYIKDIPRFPFQSIICLLPQIFLPIAIITFWKRKAYGWVLLTIFLVFSATGALWLLFQSFIWKPFSFAGFNNFFPRPSPMTYIYQLVALVSTIYVLCKRNMRELFSVNKQKMMGIIAITALVTFALFFIISY